MTREEAILNLTEEDWDEIHYCVRKEQEVCQGLYEYHRLDYLVRKLAKILYLEDTDERQD